MTASDRDIAYYDVLIQEPFATTPVPAYYTVKTKTPVLDKASDWSMSIIRFSVPTNFIPLFNFQIQGGQTQTDIDLGTYSFTLVRGATTVQTFLRYTNWNDFVVPLPQPPSALPPLYIQDQQTAYYGVFSIQHMMNMMNTAIATSWAGLPVIPGDEAPYFIYDSNTSIISLVALKANYNVDVPGHTEIYGNFEVYRFLQGFPTRRIGSNIPQGKDIKMMVQDVKNNSYDATHFIVRQQYSCLSDWNDLTSILFQSNTIPTRAEFTTNGGGISVDPSNTPSQPILNDFVPYPVEAANMRGTVLYTPSAEYRWINLIGDKELREITLTVYWTDRYQNMHQVYIRPDEQLSVKMIFQRRVKGSR